MPGRLFQSQDEAQFQLFQSFEKMVDTLENVSQSIDRIADRQRVNIDATKVLARGRLNTGSGVPIYPVRRNTAVEIRELVITNTTSAEATFNVWAVPPGVGAPRDEDLIYKGVSVAGNQTLLLPRQWALEGDWRLYISSSRNNALNVFISGVELVTV